MLIFTRTLLFIGLVVGVIAPFTFLKPMPLVKDSTTQITQNNSELKTEETNKVKATSKVNNVTINEDPLHKVDLPDFKAIYDIPTKKRKFFDFITPAIDLKNTQLAKERANLVIWQEKTILGLKLSANEALSFNSLVTAYRIDDKASKLHQINELLLHVDVIPKALVLVQAANESAWGTSRFARVGLNFFGIWCYKKGCGMVPGGRDTDAKHEVAAFQSVNAAVSGYFNNINKHSAYHEFRNIRAELRAKNQPLDAVVLAQGLMSYSERGEDYVLDIITMIRQNQRYFTVGNAYESPSSSSSAVTQTITPKDDEVQAEELQVAEPILKQPSIQGTETGKAETDKTKAMLSQG